MNPRDTRPDRVRGGGGSAVFALLVFSALLIAVPASALALSTWYDLCDKIPETLPFGSSNYFQLYLQKGEAATIPSYGSPFDVEIEYQAPDSGMYTFFYTSLGSLQDTYSCLTGEKLSWDYAHCTSTEEHPETIPLILNSADTTGYTWSYLDTIQEEQTRSSACTETTATSVSYAVDATIFVYFAPAKDEDGDGYYYPYLDCFDNPAYSFSTTIYNGATELCDGRDNDCDGEVDELDPVDEDGDGYDRYRGCNRYGWPEDCKDDPAYVKAKYIYPGAPEVCDGEDNDCDGNKDGYRDLDGDGYTYSRVCWAGEDCNDSPTNGATAHPGAPEICNDNVDNDCDGETDEPNPDGINPYKVDHDGDGYFRYTWYEFGTMNCLPANYDCNDDPSNTLAPSIHPGAAEVCNGVDDDCDGLKDEGLPLIDGDGDTYYSSDSCYWLAGGRIDCVDNDPEIYPGAAEVCDGIDNDCDGQRDEDLGIDADNDGYFSASGCVSPDWNGPLDCDDGDKDRHWYEVCDGIDNDCDGKVDEIFDYDGDGAPDMRACTSPATIPDCYDRNKYVYWGAPEICDGWDNDCDWIADEGLNVDSDGDGYYAAGSCKTKTEDCITYQPGPPYLMMEQVVGPCNPSPADCRDDLILVNPGATEICGDNVDNDCDPSTPDECCEDEDGDEHYPLSSSCSPADDCNDDPDSGGGDIFPGAEEVCGDDIDNNCDGTVDEDCCGATVSSVPSLVSQCDGRWGSLTFDNTSSTICDKGCALASLNMLMNSEGCYPDFLDTNGCSSCFTSGGDVYWGTVLGNYCSSVGMVASTDYGSKFKSVEDVLVSVDIGSDIRNGYNYILHVKGTNKKCSHFVYLTGVADDCKSLNVLDPNAKYSSVSEICGYRKFK